MKKPFPEIDDRIFEEKDWPEDCYVFEGKEKEPTIVYIPLFNRHNCKGLLHHRTQHKTLMSNMFLVLNDFVLVQMWRKSKQR